MNEIDKPAASKSLEAGILLGQNRAFAVIAGRCSAAQAGAIRRLRQEKLYKSVTEHWGEFCETHLKMSKRNADQIVALLEEFGPDYFEVAQLTRISAETYRAIQPAVKDGALHYKGQAIALIEANAQQVGVAVAEMRRETRAKAAPPLLDRLRALGRQCDAVVAGIREVANLERDDEHAAVLEAMLRKLRVELDGVARERRMRW